MKHSQFFTSAFKSGSPWSENDSGRLHLKEDDPDVFEIFYGFIYRGKIYSTKDGDITSDPIKDHEWDRLIDCWVLGEKLLSTSFKDAITDTMIEKSTASKVSAPRMQAKAYSCSVGPCGLRKLLVDMAAWRWGADSLSTANQQDNNSSFFYEVAVAMKSLLTTGMSPTTAAPFEKPHTCTYHDHGTSLLCYKKMF